MAIGIYSPWPLLGHSRVFVTAHSSAFPLSNRNGDIYFSLLALCFCQVARNIVMAPWGSKLKTARLELEGAFKKCFIGLWFPTWSWLIPLHRKCNYLLVPSNSRIAMVKTQSHFPLVLLWSTVDLLPRMCHLLEMSRKALFLSKNQSGNRKICKSSVSSSQAFRFSLQMLCLWASTCLC